MIKSENIILFSASLNISSKKKLKFSIAPWMFQKHINFYTSSAPSRKKLWRRWILKLPAGRWVTSVFRITNKMECAPGSFFSSNPCYGTHLRWCFPTVVSQVPRDICAPSNCVFKNTEKVTFSKHEHNFEHLQVTITHLSRFAATRHASLCRTSPRRSATSSQGRIVRWRPSLFRGDLDDDIYVVMKCKPPNIPT